MSEEETKTPQKNHNWDDMLSNSDYSTMLFIQKLMHNGEYEAAKKGLDKLVDFETRSEKADMERALIRLMEAIILWKESPEYRTGEQVHEIHEAYEGVEFFIEEGTELNYDYYSEIWDEAYKEAKVLAEIELQRKLSLDSLTWEDVFEKEYSMFNVTTDSDG